MQDLVLDRLVDVMEPAKMTQSPYARVVETQSDKDPAPIKRYHNLGGACVGAKIAVYNYRVLLFKQTLRQQIKTVNHMIG